MLRALAFLLSLWSRTSSVYIWRELGVQLNREQRVGGSVSNTRTQNIMFGYSCTRVYVFWVVPEVLKGMSRWGIWYHLKHLPDPIKYFWLDPFLLLESAQVNSIQFLAYVQTERANTRENDIKWRSSLSEYRCYYNGGCKLRRRSIRIPGNVSTMINEFI